MRTRISLAMAIVLAALVARADDAPGRYEIDAKAGELTLFVKKRGALSAFAHDHDLEARAYRGTITFDARAPERSSVELAIDARELVVLDPHLSDKDRAKVLATMRSDDVLDVERFPEIAFESQSVGLRERAADEKPDGIALAVEGKLTLHGVSRKRRLLVRVVEKDGKLEVQGEHRLKQSEFGIEPYSTAFGAVGVEDEIALSWRIVATRAAKSK